MAIWRVSRSVTINRAMKGRHETAFGVLGKATPTAIALDFNSGIATSGNQIMNMVLPAKAPRWKRSRVCHPRARLRKSIQRVTFTIGRRGRVAKRQGKRIRSTAIERSPTRCTIATKAMVAGARLRRQRIAKLRRETARCRAGPNGVHAACLAVEAKVQGIDRFSARQRMEDMVL